MDLSTRVVMATMQHPELEEDLDKMLDLALRVQREIFCPMTGKILDYRNARLIMWTSQAEPGETKMAACHGSVEADVVSLAFGDLEDVEFKGLWHPSAEVLALVE